jgi:hypothetical protein
MRHERSDRPFLFDAAFSEASGRLLWIYFMRRQWACSQRKCAPHEQRTFPIEAGC